MDFFQCLLFDTRLFSLVLMFPGLRIEAPQEENQEIKFPLLCTKHAKLSKDKQHMFLLKVGCPEVDLLTSRA